ncbi:helicase-associated domain-containing protein [Microbacterium sp.]|uniref:helicase-associated domain-containing protein n=1 Tax=Microbacterium sp. TaxID=51671 RepID=UPI003735FD50
MTVTASDARSLATHLATLDADALADLFAARAVSPTSTWADFFDVAEGLLEPAQLARAVATVTDHEVAALRDALAADRAVDDPADLAARALVAPDGTVYAAVADAVRAAEPVAPASVFTGAPESDAAVAERVFGSAASLADLLHSAAKAPLARIGTGALSASDRRRLVESGAVATAEDADRLVAIADLAGLLVGVGERSWMVTNAGLDWLRRRTAERWDLVAHSLRTQLPPALRSDGGGWRATEEWAGAHPFDPAWPDRIAELAALWVQWGILGPDGTPSGWARRFAAGGEADLAALQALLPHEVDKVYLQNDLTAIAPGPLEPQLDLRLRTMARRESRAQAATYRFTAESIGAALAGGETAASLTDFLTTLSLTGVPQPLAYEIERSATRHGRLRVGPDAKGHTRISGDPDLLEALAVDQALRPLGLLHDGTHLLSRSGVDTTFWMLSDARYPVLAVNIDGEPRALDRHHVGEDEHSAPTALTQYRTLVERLQANSSADTDAAWLERELDQAVRTRAVVTLDVRMPDGSTREVTVEAAGLGGGRLRGRDRAADVERTLPLSSIISVRPA